MLFKKFKLLLIILLFYQTPLHSKSTSFQEFNSKNLSKYFSGIVALENKQNSDALTFFNSSKTIIDRHDPYLEKFVITLVLESQVSKAINILKSKKENYDFNFLEAYILLALDSLKTGRKDIALKILTSVPEFLKDDRFSYIILSSLEQYIYVFDKKKILPKKEKFGNLSLIAETFQSCYLGSDKTSSHFLNLINNNQSDYSRYIFFYITYLIENNKINEANELTEDLNYINSTLLLSQGKSWLEKNEISKFIQFFSCKNHNDIVGEFLFLISNLYSSQNDYKKSNFYLSLSNYLNPKFIFNLSLVVENLYMNENYEKAKKVLKSLINIKIFIIGIE